MKTQPNLPPDMAKILALEAATQTAEDFQRVLLPSLQGLAHALGELNQKAELHSEPLVESILRSQSRDIHQIEHTLDTLLDFCGHPPVLALYRKLCRHYWDIDPSATASYVAAYRDRWDTDGKEDGCHG